METRHIITLVFVFSSTLITTGSGFSDVDLYCDFESACTGLQWGTPWEVTEANTTHSHRYVPPEDHTYGNASGHFLYLNRTNREATIHSPQLQVANASKCFEFFYVANGSGFHYLHVTLDAGTLRETWFNVSTSNTTDWQPGIVELPEDTYTIRLRANSTLRDGVVAVDDVRIFDCGKNGSTPSPPAEPVVWCDFEHSPCAFTNDLDHNTFNWIWEQAETAHSNDSRRPMVDHTTGTQNGFYSYVESKRDHIPGEDGLTMYSYVDVPDDNMTYCAELYYFTYGLGTLHVFNVSDERYVEEITYANLTSTSRNWTRMIYPLAMPGRLRLAISAVVSSERGRVGVAIDDVKVYQCPFVHTPPLLVGNRYLSRTSCDFDTSLCDFKNKIDSTADWRRMASSNTSIPDTGHSSGHILVFKIVEPSIYLKTYEAVLNTPPLMARSGWCLDFFYYLNNATNSSSDVIDPVKLRVSHGAINLFQADNRDFSDRWHHARNIPLMPGMGQAVHITATVKMKGLQIALDEIKIGSCVEVSPESTTAGPTTTEHPTTTTEGATTTTTEQTTTSSTHVTTVSSSPRHLSTFVVGIVSTIAILMSGL